MKVQVIILALLISICGWKVGFAQDDFFFDESSQKESFDFEGTLMNVRGILVESNDQQQAVLGRSQKKLDKALQGFLNTAFMDRYREIKLEAESLAGTFKALSQKFSPKEVGRVRHSYNKIATKFNILLTEVKNDFMDRKKLKLIRKEPEMYSNSLQFKLSELKDEYSEEFERSVAEITGSEVYAAVPLGAILGLIKLSIDFTNFLASASYEARRVKEEHLMMYLMEPYRFRSWEDIPIGEGDYYANENNSNEDQGGYDDADYYEDSEYDEEMDTDYQDADDFVEPEPADTVLMGSKRVLKMNPFEETEKDKKTDSNTKKKKKTGND